MMIIKFLEKKGKFVLTGIRTKGLWNGSPIYGPFFNHDLFLLPMFTLFLQIAQRLPVHTSSLTYLYMLFAGPGGDVGPMGPAGASGQRGPPGIPGAVGKYRKHHAIQNAKGLQYSNCHSKGIYT